MKTIMKLEDVTTIAQLTDFLSGTQAADRLQKARQKVFKTIHGRTLKSG
jgi:hypothetical protein